jgi:uncharacterized protein (TIGR01777 family)
MKLLVSGASGLIGSAFVAVASAAGHQIRRLARQQIKDNSIYWDPARGVLDGGAVEGVDAVVHLAGESIAAGRWTAAQKARIRDSRVQGTTLLAGALAKANRPPGVLVSASAVGYYGNRGDEILREDSPPGSDFLADVCKQWEASTRAASSAGIRVVHLRTGVVLAKNGGALPKMAFPFKVGVGGRIGSGRQYMSWIDLEDEVNAILHCIQTVEVRGAVNAVSTSPVTNADFTKVLGRVLSRPTLFPLPATAARLMLGEMADALLLSSQRVEPARLTATGFQFRHRDLEETLRAILR